MASSFPGALDALSNPTGSSNLSDGSVLHSAQHANANDAVEAVQAILGVNPQGAKATVGARIAAIESVGGGAVDAAHLPLFVRKAPPVGGADGVWPARPTADGAVMVFWDGPPNADASGPATVPTGTGGMLPGDKWLSHP